MEMQEWGCVGYMDYSDVLLGAGQSRYSRGDFQVVTPDTRLN